MYGGESAVREYDMQISCIRAVFGFMRVVDTTFMSAAGLDFGGDEYRVHHLEKARVELTRLTKTW